MMKRVKLMYKRASKWLYDHTPLWCGIALGLLLGFMEFIAVAPDPYVEWFYGPSREASPKEKRYLQITYKNGIPTDTTEIVELKPAAALD